MHDFRCWSEKKVGFNCLYLGRDNRPLPRHLGGSCELRARLMRCFDGPEQQRHHRWPYTAARCRGEGGTSPRVCLDEVWEALCFLRHFCDELNARPNSRDPEITHFDDWGGLPRVFLRKSHPNQPRNKPEQPMGALGAPQHALLHLSGVTSPHTQSTARAKYR